MKRISIRARVLMLAIQLTCMIVVVAFGSGTGGLVMAALVGMFFGWSVWALVNELVMR